MSHWIELWNKPKYALSHSDELYLALPGLIVLGAAMVISLLWVWWRNR